MFRAPRRGTALAAALVAAAATALTIRANSFTAWGADSSAYADAAAQWAEGRLFHPAHFWFWTPWDLDRAAEVPYGRTAGATPGTIVGIYPPGYPLLLAAAQSIGGPLAPHVVSPFFLGVLVWCVFLLASRASTPTAGLAACVLVAATPLSVAHALFPMSDVPAAALWTMAWTLAMRPGVTASLAAGAGVALAILVRPNLAPLGLVVAAIVAARRKGHGGWLAAAGFIAVAALGPATLLWTQALLHGSPFATGYPTAEAFFRLDRVPVNAVHYPAVLLGLHGPVVFAGLLLTPLAIRPSAANTEAALVIRSALGIVFINYALLLPYLTFEGWYWLRFLLPGVVALFILLAAALDRLRRWSAARVGGGLQWLALVPIGFAIAVPRSELAATFEHVATYPRVALMGAYLREALPPNAVLIAGLQSGSAAFYTRRPVIRWDLIRAGSLDPILDRLERAGYAPGFVLDEAMEGAEFRQRHAASRYGRLDWPTRAQFWGATAVSYWAAADREPALNGETTPLDLLVIPGAPMPPVAQGSPPVVAMPRSHEARAFRAALEAVYRDRLGRAPVTSAVEPTDSLHGMLRYLRYRLSGCAHGEAASRVFVQLDSREVPSLCRSIDPQAFPPRNEVVEFRRQLESRAAAIENRPYETAVDLEGEAVWTQEFLRHVLGGCPARAATARVIAAIDGRVAVLPCGRESR